MSPQLNPAQLQHAIDNGTKLVEAKKLEIGAYQRFFADAPNVIALLFDALGIPEMVKSDNPALERFDQIREFMDIATCDLFQSKIARAEVELEELEMQVKAYKFIQSQAGNRIQVPNFKSQG